MCDLVRVFLEAFNGTVFLRICTFKMEVIYMESELFMVQYKTVNAWTNDLRTFTILKLQRYTKIILNGPLDGLRTIRIGSRRNVAPDILIHLGLSGKLKWIQRWINCIPPVFKMHHL